MIVKFFVGAGYELYFLYILNEKKKKKKRVLIIKFFCYEKFVYIIIIMTCNASVHTLTFNGMTILNVLLRRHDTTIYRYSIFKLSQDAMEWNK